jgi:hypothetical protein
MSDATSPAPSPEPGAVRRIVDGAARALLEILVFTLIGPLAVAAFQIALGLPETLIHIAQHGIPETKPGGESFWFGIVAVFWASSLYLPIPFFFAGAAYAIAARVLGQRLWVALAAGLIGIVGFGWAAGVSLPTTDGAYLSAGNVGLAAGLAAGVAACWWLSLGRRAVRSLVAYAGLLILLAAIRALS